MSGIPVEEIRSFILARVEVPLAARQLTPNEVLDDFDLLMEGVIDSFGIVDLFAAVEERFGLAIDFDGLDADNLTVLGPLCRYIGEQSRVTEEFSAKSISQ